MEPDRPSGAFHSSAATVSLASFAPVDSAVSLDSTEPQATRPNAADAPASAAMIFFMLGNLL